MSKPILVVALSLAGFIRAQQPTAHEARAVISGSYGDFNTPRQANFFPTIRAAKSIRVVSWNIDRGTELPLIGQELEKDPADLYLLQEVDSNTKRGGKVNEAAELAHRLKMNMSYGIEFEELSQEVQSGQAPSPAYTGQATLTRLPIRSSRILRFQRQSAFWKPHGWLPSSLPLMQRRLGNRIALVTDLEFAGRPLIVYNLHLESRSLGKIQSEQLDEVFEDMKKYQPGTAFILGGDLNTKYLPSSFLHRLEREGFRSATGERIERTHAIAMALDWIFVRGPIAIEDGRVNRDFRGSDHYPIYAALAAQHADLK